MLDTDTVKDALVSSVLLNIFGANWIYLKNIHFFSESGFSKYIEFFI